MVLLLSGVSNHAAYVLHDAECAAVRVLLHALQLCFYVGPCCPPFISAALCDVILLGALDDGAR
jgi:hypothetical protein